MADAPFREGPAALGLVAATLFTVPVGSTYTLRNIHVANSSDVPAKLNLSIGADAVTNRLFSALVIPGDGALDWSGYMPLDAGELIAGFSDINNALVVTISGVDTT